MELLLLSCLLWKGPQRGEMGCPLWWAWHLSSIEVVNGGLVFLSLRLLLVPPHSPPRAEVSTGRVGRQGGSGAEGEGAAGRARWL